MPVAVEEREPKRKQKKANKRQSEKTRDRATERQSERELFFFVEFLVPNTTPTNRGLESDHFSFLLAFNKGIYFAFLE
jgi:hypothetical protein